jgi:hypothetical protein
MPAHQAEGGIAAIGRPAAEVAAPRLPFGTELRRVEATRPLGTAVVRPARKAEGNADVGADAGDAGRASRTCRRTEDPLLLTAERLDLAVEHAVACARRHHRDEE